MQAFAVTIPGFEDIAAQEIHSLIHARPMEEQEVCIVFSTTKEKLAELTYRAQSLKRTAELLAEVAIAKDSEKTLQHLTTILTPILQKLKQQYPDKTIKCATERSGSHGFTSSEITDFIHYLCYQQQFKTDFKKPDLSLFFFINEDKGYLGIDYAGFDLSKRDYKIYTHPEALNGSVAFSLLMLAEYKPEHVLLDPFCGSATIGIEAALFAAKKSPHFFHKEKLLAGQLLGIDFSSFDHIVEFPGRIYSLDIQQHHVANAKKNSQIMDVHKLISFSRIAVDWLDIKLEKASVDCMVTHPPSVGGHLREDAAKKLYQQFLAEANFLLKKQGVAVILVRDSTLLEQLVTGFTVTKRTIFQGEQQFSALRLVKE